MYHELEEDFFVQLEHGEVEAFNAASKGIKLRQFVQGGLYWRDEDQVRHVQKIHRAKLRALEELLEICEGKPILCAIQFRFELEMIRKHFKRKFPIIAGGVSPHESNLILKRWDEGKIKMILAHPASMSHGLNLQYGGHIICWYGLTWSLEQYDQLIGRLNRRGQTEKVIVHVIHIPGTIDDVIIKSLQTKSRTQNTLMHELHEYYKKRREA
jgi:SNF2 family DNA or RNA helicase